MSLTVLNVAYPFAAVGPDAVGGAEQILTQLDRALTEAGHTSLVLACAGSRVRGTHLRTRAVRGAIDDALRDAIQREHREALARALSEHPVDIVHLHGVDFTAYLPPPGIPALVTLHLPPSWYPEGAFFLDRPRVCLHCVSEHQRQACPPGARLGPVIGNGVPVEPLQGPYSKRGYAVALGRICWEKGFHLALDAARAARVGLVLGGSVYPYPSHRDYFVRHIAPKLDTRRRFVGAVGFRRKRRLLAGARALLVPSLVPETSSLVAMEALACGTPVIAFGNGALPDIVEPGRTGFIVGSVDEMAEAIHAAADLDPEACRDSARRRFSLHRMTSRYLELYEQLARGASAQPSQDHADSNAA